MTELEDLVGGGETKPKRKRAPQEYTRGAKNKPFVARQAPRKKLAPPTPEEVEEFNHDYSDRMLRHTEPELLDDLFAGVTVSFLAHLFGMNRLTINKRLANCDPVRRVGKGKAYNLVQAAAYLIEPKIDLKEYLRTLRPTELPPGLHKDFWDAMNKQQKWSLEAGDLWHTEDVLDVFGEVFKTLKTTIQLWVDNVDRLQELTGEQRQILMESADGLQDDLYRALVDLPKQRKTVNVASQVDDDGLPVLRENALNAGNKSS